MSLREHLTEFIEDGHLPSEHIEMAAKSTGIRPDSQTWRVFFDHLLLAIGGLSLAFSLLFFIAYNWQEMGRFIKFALVESVLVMSVLLYLCSPKQSFLSRVALLLSSLSLGGALALFGQIYQTGADTWQLFFSWALLMSPWVLVSRFNVLWFLWWGLFNLSILLYFETFGGLFSPLYRSDAFLWVCLLFNGVTWLLWELCSLRYAWMQPVWAIRAIACYTGLCVSWLAIESVTLSYASLSGFWCWLAWLGVTLAIYYQRKPDLFMLAGCCVSLICVTLSFLVENVIDFTDAGSFLVLALSIVGMGASAAAWLRSVNKKWSKP